MTTGAPGLAINADVVRDAVREREGLRKKPRDRRVCECGHGLSRHFTEGGGSVCAPARMLCQCTRMRAVLEVQDTRLFLYATDNVGEGHALSKGVIASLDREHEIEWLVDLVCEKCGAGEVVPVGVTKGFERVVIAKELPQATMLLCDKCLKELS